jgi:glycosyltransferase involved in cell wall biosynthesis
VSAETRTDGQAPLVSIGLPVYNGENFLREALESLCAQTLADLEIVISDNASTDGTGAICREFAARDPRVRYIRQERNVGAGPNYNFVFHASRGRYFKWAAHDDYMDPEAMAVCAAALEADPQTVLCHPKLVDVDEHGGFLAEFDRGTAGLGPAPDRFFQVIQIGHNCAEVFGLTRRSALLETGLIRDYTDSDRTLLGELALRGRLRQVDGARFYRRVHGRKSDKVFRTYHERAAWFNPANEGKLVLSAWNQLRDLLGSWRRCRLPLGQKLSCLWLLAKVTKWNAPLYRLELAWAWRHRFGSGRNAGRDHAGGATR